MGRLIGKHYYVTALILTTLGDVDGCSHAVCLSSSIFRTRGVGTILTWRGRTFYESI